MNHLFWLIDGLLAGRPGPVLAPWDLVEFQEAGMKAIVSLNSEPDTVEIEAHGLRHHSLPMPLIMPVTLISKEMMLRELEPVLEVMHTEMSAGNPIVVHCHAGKDRTGLALTAYLVRYHGLEIDEAIDRVRAVRPIAMSAPGYEGTARRFAEKEIDNREV